MKAIYEGTVIAESENTIVIEGNHYFPEADVNKEFLISSTTHTPVRIRKRSHQSKVVQEPA